MKKINLNMKKVLLIVALISYYALYGCSSDSDDNPYKGYPPMVDPEDICTSMDDLNFMKYCYENFDVNGDGKVSVSEANAVKAIQIEKDIISIKGIQYFSNLDDLRINTPITSFDISKNPNLVQLRISSKCMITSLDLSGNKKLAYLFLPNSKLSSLDVSKNLNLDYLDIQAGGEYSDFPFTGYPVTETAFIDSYNSPIKELWMAKGQNIKFLVIGNNTTVRYK